MIGLTRQLLLSLGTATALSLGCCGVAAAGMFPLHICGSSGRDPGDGLSWSATSPLVATAQCPAAGLGLSFYAGSGKTAGHNSTSAFKVTAPPGVTVYSLHAANASSQGIGNNRFGSNGWWGEFYWSGGPGPAGSSGPINDLQYTAGGCCSQSNLQSRTIGWFVACNQPTCSTGNAGIERGMDELDLIAQEDQAPAIVATGADNLWYQNGWVRGTWPASFTATDPSGVCGAVVVFGSLPAINTPTPDTAPNRHTWKQCPDQSVSAAVDTTASDGSLGRGTGAMTLRLTATNTAAVTANSTKTVYVDNSTPTISLAGPTDAPATAGTQYITATAGSSPSGIADVICTVDGGPAQSYPGTGARVPVAGIGQHAVSCYAENKAVDPSGTHGRSEAAAWSLKIGQPTVVGIAFDKPAGLRCRRARRRVSIPGHWITVRRHGKPLKRRTRGRTKTVTVLNCRPRAVHRRTARVVSFGHRATVSGWLGSVSGTAIAGHTVHVLTAPDNGSSQFTQAAAVVTAPNGTWSAALPAGPSRIVEAVYNGDPTTESASSGQVRLIVPAKVELRAITPRRVAWGGTIRIIGQLAGGWLPPGGALVRLRLGQGRGYSTYGVQTHVTGSGRFSTTYTFGAGDPNVYVTYWFQIGSLPQGDYPYAPALSRRLYVIVGGHPRTPRPRG